LNLFDPFEAITSSIHEGGHALYEQGLPEAMFGTPLGEAVSLGIHESQSRLYENHVARSLPFWEKHFKRFESYFPDQLKGFLPEDLYGLINKVQAGPIRVEADELTYNLHVFIRFEIEDALFNSDLKVEQLPELWNETYKQYLSVDVKSDSEGVLQDIHWAGGSFGYFPTYTVGTIVAAQLYRSMESTMNVQDLQEVKRWLNTTIHQYGRQYTAKELVERATGKSFSSADFIDYSTEKYSRLYRLNT
jgi:carboxypeptidase Taq